MFGATVNSAGIWPSRLYFLLEGPDISNVWARGISQIPSAAYCAFRCQLIKKPFHPLCSYQPLEMATFGLSSFIENANSHVGLKVQHWSRFLHRNAHTVGAMCVYIGTTSRWAVVVLEVQKVQLWSPFLCKMLGRGSHRAANYFTKSIG